MRFFFCLLFFASIHSQAQEAFVIDTARVIKKARRVPGKYTKDPVTLAQKLTEDYDDNSRKVLAITSWITRRIKYDYKSFLANRMYKNRTLKTLKKRRAMCSEYAELFNEMCAAVDIQALEVAGYVYPYDFFSGDTLYRAEHAWSVVNIDGRWELMDLTWGSGRLVERKQCIRRLLWKYFEVPYTIRLKYKHEYDPQWFYVPPEQIVFSHMPVIEEFQLLNPSVPIEAFQNASAIKDHLDPNERPTASVKSVAIFAGKDQLSQWGYEGEEGHRFNSQNNRIEGFNLFLIADSLFRKNSDPGSHLIGGTMDELVHMSKLTACSDSLMDEALNDNAIEYSTYSGRNSKWKKDLKNNNKRFTQSLRDRKKLNLKQRKTLRRIGSKLRRYERYTSNSKRKFKMQRIYRTKRAKLDSKERLEYHESQIQRTDSLLKIIPDYVRIKDSLIMAFSPEIQNRMKEVEKENHEIHKSNKKELRAMVKHRRARMEMVHWSYTDIDKFWFEIPNDRANQNNLQFTDSIIKGLYKNLMLTYDTMKCVIGNHKNALAAVKKAKRNSMKERGEDKRYETIIESHRALMEDYVTQLKDYVESHGKVYRRLKTMNWTLSRSVTWLKKDRRIETKRYRIYGAYRKKIKRREDYRIRFIQTKLSDMKRTIERTIEKRQRQVIVR